MVRLRYNEHALTKGVVALRPLVNEDVRQQLCKLRTYM